jgi:hypothetical protein
LNNGSKYTVLKNFLFLLILSALFSCKKTLNEDEKEFTLYHIAEGGHRSVNKVKIFRGDELKFSFKFDSSAVYTTKKTVTQHSINKLYGFSDCGSSHQQNSARFGWRWFNKRLEIHAYCYSEAERCITLVGYAELNQEYDCSIKIREGNYEFRMDGHNITVPRVCQEKKKPRYYLYPYFGGEEAAPHDIKIWIRD